MTRLRPAYTWLAFGLCLVAVGGAMTWMSASMLRLERAEFENQRTAARAENERLALWRMESMLVPLVARENARPPAAYKPWYSPKVYTKWLAPIRAGEIIKPSELLTRRFPHVLVHFEVGPNGKLTSPQVPTGSQLDVTEVEHASPQKILAAEKRLKQLRKTLLRDRLLAALSLPALPPSRPPVQVANNGPLQGGHLGNGNSNDTQAGQQQAANPGFAKNVAEFEKRQKASNQVLKYNQIDTGKSRGTVKPMKSIWLDGKLILAREFVRSGRQSVQGCVLDWPSLRSSLVNEVKDLLPRCKLVPIQRTANSSTHTPQYMLASIPVQLQSGELPDASLPLGTNTRAALGISWVCFLVSASAVALLLRAAMRLSERRGAFVSAVTHELRTPLTTFRLYTEMLSRGMVDDARSREYLATLHQEADRLGHLVENVLTYARLESPRKRPVTEEFQLASVLDRMKETLTRRVEEAEMVMEFGSGPSVVTVGMDDASREGNDDAAGVGDSIFVRADTAAVERIVFNLIDNACKYGRNSDDRRIHLECRTNGPLAEVRVTDHGPGISSKVERRMFEPFAKSDKEAANTAPGVGLGLSLSRGLARSMGGDLQLDRSVKNGARFVLSLPRCRPTNH